MIAGATYTLPIDIGAALSDVAEVIVTLRSEKTGTKRVKRYPHDNDSYLMDDGRIGLRLSQRDTLMLVGRVIVEAQVNLIAGSVAKTITAETVISDTLGTEFVPGAADNGENMLDGVTIEIGEPIIPLAVTATDVNAVHYTPEKKTNEQKKQARENIGALGEDELGAAVDDALAKAKESGEFDGEKGDDYVLTEGDKTEIAEMAAGKLQPGIDELSEAIVKLDDSKADDIVDTATGEVLALTDAAATPLRGLVVYGKSTQDGTPTPDAPVPIVSVGGDGVMEVVLTGRNIIDVNAMLGDALTSNGDGTYTLARSEDERYSKTFITKSPPGVYACYAKILDNTTAGGNIKIEITTDDGKKYYTNSTGSLVLIQGNIKSVALYLNLAETVGTYVRFENLILEKGSLTDYEPYKPIQTFPISTSDGLRGIPVTSGGNYTDANGQQWVCDEIDFVRGVRVQRIYEKNITVNDIKKAYVINLTSDSWQISGAHSIYFSGVISPIPIDSTGKTCLSDRFTGKGYVFDNSEVPDTLYVRGNVTYMRIADALTGIVAEDTKDVKIEKILTFIEKIGGFTIQYRLANPIETLLTDDELAAYRAAALCTNYPNTTIYADDNAGLAVDYKADTKRYIDRKFAELAAAIVNN